MAEGQSGCLEPPLSVCLFGQGNLVRGQLEGAAPGVESWEPPGWDWRVRGLCPVLALPLSARPGSGMPLGLGEVP